MSEEAVVELTEVEQQAMEMGWKPESEFNPGDSGKKFISADEYVRNDSFFSEIRGLKKDRDLLKKTVEQLSEHHKKVAATEYERARKSLIEEKKEALALDDYDKVIEIDDKIMKSDREAENSQKIDTNEAFNSWIVNNPWYNENNEMREMADMLGNGYMQQNPKASVNDAYKYVEAKVKKAYKDSFNESDDVSPVLSGTNSSSSAPRKGKQITKANLSDEQRKVMNNFVRQGILTEKQYIDELKATGELG